MSLEGVDVVEVTLPVLDEAAVVRGQHPHTIVAPAHAPYRTIMALRSEDREKGRGRLGRVGKEIVMLEDARKYVFLEGMVSFLKLD